MMLSTLRLATLTAAATFALSAPTLAQQAPAGNAPAQQMQQIDVSDSQMQAFANVQQQLQTLQQQYQAEAEKAENKQAASALMQKANQHATQVVKQSPLTVKEYKQIVMLLPHDQELQQQYKKALSR